MDIEAHVWRISYMIDTVMKRQILHLISTDPESYTGGSEHEIKIKTPSINVEGVKRKHLMNVGLLMLEGGRMNDEGELEKEVSVNMIVNVTPDKDGGLTKLVINPMDE
jgi:hypothetical protein